MAKKDKPPVVYWDSTNFICLFNVGEEDRAEECKRILKDARNGKVRIVTSALTLAEVFKANPSDSSLVESPMDDLFEHSSVEIVDLDRLIGEKARQLCRDCGMKPRDAIHLATAEYFRVDRFQSWNTSDFERAKDLHVLPVEEPIWRGQKTFEEALKKQPKDQSQRGAG